MMIIRESIRPTQDGFELSWSAMTTDDKNASICIRYGFVEVCIDGDLAFFLSEPNQLCVDLQQTIDFIEKESKIRFT